MIFLVLQGKTSPQEFLKVNSISSSSVVFIDDSDKTSISKELNRLLLSDSESHVAVLTSDLILPAIFVNQARESMIKVQNRWPTCVATTARGISLFEHGYNPSRRIDYLVVAGYERLVNIETPVVSSSADFVLIDLLAIRSQGFAGFATNENDDFDVWFSLELSLKNCNVIASPIMAAFSPNSVHVSRSAQQLTQTSLDFIEREFNARKIETLRGSFVLEINAQDAIPTGKPVIEEYFLKSLVLDRKVPILTIVIRTQFKRLASLRRCLASVLSFAAAYDDESLRIVLVSDRPAPTDLVVPSEVEFVSFEHQPGKDTRFLLVADAVDHAKSEYYHFVDDDDWLFPNNALKLKQFLSLSPKESVFFADTQHFLEGDWQDNGIDSAKKFLSKPGPAFPGNLFMRGLAGRNHIPFCGVVLPGSIFANLSRESFENVEYAEDYFLILTALYQNITPIVFGHLLAGISIRDEGNTVTEFGAVKWQVAKANVAYHLVNNSINSGKFDSPNASSGRGRRKHTVIFRAFRVLFDGRLWGMARRVGVFSKLLSGQVSLRFVFMKIRTLIKQGW